MRRKNGMDRKHRAGLYLRLSKEDEAQGQSGSISNQRAILERYAQDQGWEVAGCYIDDGYSGLHFDRPGFQRLLSDIEAGLVNLVLTKDLSRLGRDYIDTGYYLERYFPSRQVRYIALADGIDTFASSSAQNDMGPFKSVMNDLYAKDISQKVRAVMDTKREAGQLIFFRPKFIENVLILVGIGCFSFFDNFDLCHAWILARIGFQHDPVAVDCYDIASVQIILGDFFPGFILDIFRHCHSKNISGSLSYHQVTVFSRRDIHGLYGFR